MTRTPNPVAKLAAFAVVLAASFGVGAAVGAALPDLGPSADPTPSVPTPAVPAPAVSTSSVPTGSSTPTPLTDPGHEAGHQP